jgi:lysophospholipase L1-like esterase
MKFRFSAITILGVLMLFFLASAPKPVKVLMAGDSTMADKVLYKTVFDSLTGKSYEEPFLERGWGQLLPELLNDKALVKNYARNGRSTRSFIEEGLWTELLNNTEKGDFVIIQFGHNDESVEKTGRYTNPAQFRLNFVAFVAEVRLKGATPVLCTPVARRNFDSTGRLVPTHGIYPDIIRSVARDYRVPMIDLEKLTSEWLQNECVEGSKKYFHKIAPGISRLYPNGLDDNTHFNEAGARTVAEMFVKEVATQKIKGFEKILKK